MFNKSSLEVNTRRVINDRVLQRERVYFEFIHHDIWQLYAKNIIRKRCRGVR